MLTRNEAVNEVLAVYDEMDRMVDQLMNLHREREGERLERIIVSECAGDVIDPMTAKLCEFARRAIVDKALHRWREICAKRLESGEVVYSPRKFEGWLLVKVQRDELPSWMSYDEFIVACDGELREMYELERKAAFDSLMKKEAKKKEKKPKEDAEKKAGEADE